MRVVAYTEILILLRVVLGAVFFQNSLLTPLVYIQFLRMRHYQSPFTQRAFVHAGQLIDGYVRKPGVPPVMVTAWDTTRSLLARWSSTTIQQQQPAPAAAR